MISEWSSRRRAVVFIVLIIIVLAAISIPLYFFLSQRPDCFNGRQDGDESGVDCGGSCQLLCRPEILPVVSRGDARLLKIATSTYQVVVVVQNPNVNGIVRRAPYTFSIYGSGERKPISVISGSTYINRNSEFAIFAGPFTLNSTSTLRAAFTWGELTWEKSDEPQPSLAVSNLVTDPTTPRLEAEVANKTQKNVSNIEAVAVLTDVEGNIVAAAKTFIEGLLPQESTPIVFTWPRGFSINAPAKKVYLHVLPDKSYIQ